MEQYTVYVQLDSENRVIAVNSSAFVDESWGIAIDSGSCDKFHHAQGNYLDGGLFTDDGICRWKYADNVVEQRTEQEIELEREHRPPEPPSEREIDRADIDYCLMMLEG